MYANYLAAGGAPYGAVWEFYKHRVRGNDFTSLFSELVWLRRAGL